MSSASGPSADVLHHRRTLNQVKKRGRWMTDSSVRRYEKSAKTMSLSAGLNPELVVYLQKCVKALPQVLLRNQPPLPPP